MDIVIRGIEARDYPAATELLVSELWDNKIGGGHVAPFFDKVKNDGNYKTFVAEADNCVVGLVSAVKIFWAASGEAANTLFVQGIAVKNEYRNKGIGKALLKHIEDCAKSEGIGGVGLQSGVRRTSAHAFYERNGYAKSYYFGKC